MEIPSRLIPVLLLTVFLTACGMGGPAHAPPRAGTDAVVDMGFTSFDPPVVTIRQGDTIEWRNTSIITHTVTDDPHKNPASYQLPRKAAAFDSGDLKAGSVYTHTFTVPGTYRYVCLHHEDEGMKGTVIVK